MISIGFFKKAISLFLCAAMLVLAVACGSDKKKEELARLNNISLVDKVEIKYSFDCNIWNELTCDASLFSDNDWAAGDVEVLYVLIKNLSSESINYKLSMNVFKGNIKAEYAVIDGVCNAFEDNNAALNAAQGLYHAFDSGYITSHIMEKDNSAVHAVVVKVPDDTQGGKMELGVNFSVISCQTESANVSKVKDGEITVFADAFSLEEDSIAVVKNDNETFRATFKEVKKGSLASAKVTPVFGYPNTYNITLKLDGKSFNGEANIDMFIGFGRENVSVSVDGTQVAANYALFTGMVSFIVAKDCTVSISATADETKTGVAVAGVDRLFNNFNEAIDYVVSEEENEFVGDITFMLFGKVMYHIGEGQEISYIGNRKGVNKINIVGGNKAATLMGDKDSGSILMLPVADDGMQITYDCIIFDNEIENSNTDHFDYRGLADINIKNSTFYKTLITRGAKSNVLIDGCTFRVKTKEDSLKGYCYYSATLNGNGSETNLTFSNNDVSESWGGINLDRALANYTIEGNTFANINCSKPAIQLSRAATVVVENNTFRNIKDENAIYFYQAYAAKSTVIRYNDIDADFLFYTDSFGLINNFSEFIFENNVISAATDLKNGHVTDLAAGNDQPHGYEVDTDFNKIKK